MTRYFFHLVIGPVFIRDREGTELADDAAAREHGLLNLAAVSRARTLKRQSPLTCSLVVADEDGERFRIPFVELGSQEA
ncbi:MAG TPA: hypothetical protein VF744_17270 [Beijerinckiaceae bacterium]